MAGINYKVIGKTTYDFQNLGALATQDIILAKGIPVFAYREGVLQVRVHNHAGWSAGQSITINVYMDGYTDEDPNTDFVYTAGAVAASVTWTSGGDPQYFTDYLKFGGAAGGFGGYLRVVLHAVQANHAPPTTFPLTLSIDLSLKA